MTFNAAFIAQSPPTRSVTSPDGGFAFYRLFSVLVRDTDQAIDVCRRLVADEDLHSILLCPGNSHKDVALWRRRSGRRLRLGGAGDAPASARRRGDGERRLVLGASHRLSRRHASCRRSTSSSALRQA